MAAPSNDTPTVLVVFGATGDLMERKIVPSLYHLYEKGRLPKRFRLVGFSRRPIPDDDFRATLTDIIRAHHATGASRSDVAEFVRLASYSQGHFDEVEAYGRLVDGLNAIDDEWQTCANKLFYLAVPPQFYRTILERISASGLANTCGEQVGGGGWTRLIVEKPFGKDARTAQELDELLGTLFEEHQIYRIDHYLAKEMLQGIMSFRFSNNLLEPSWDNRAIERIDVDLLETIGAEDRGPFYDGVGALRDVGQNHLLQMLSLVTMGQPSALEARARPADTRGGAPLHVPGAVRRVPRHRGGASRFEHRDVLQDRDRARLGPVARRPDLDAGREEAGLRLQTDRRPLQASAAVSVRRHRRCREPRRLPDGASGLDLDRFLDEEARFHLAAGGARLQLLPLREGGEDPVRRGVREAAGRRDRR
jgi:hypothetical protein